ncbi:DnaD domain protein [Tissierella creatinini]|nr:DnaD domain protein [Tissierella creatinini]TJX62551.1 DnaD domain protein [Soehngenia saccharolytica]
MSFTLETTDMDLGDTPIENIFINDFMPMANGTYVKVYLLGFKYAHDKDEKIDVTNMTIAKHLDIPLEDVLRAWDFWEEKGIIVKEDNHQVNYKVRFLNLKQLYIKNNIGLINQKQEPRKTQEEAKFSTKDLIEANQMPIINSMFNSIDFIMRRQTSPGEKKIILEWIHEYNMNPDVIEKAFYYSSEKRGIRKMNYVEGIIKNWYSEGLTTLDAIMEKMKAEDEAFYNEQRIMKSLGLQNRPIRGDEKNLVDKWFNEYKFTLDIILAGCETDKNVKPSISYVNGTLKNWFEKGVKTLEDIERLDKPVNKEESKVRPQFKKSLSYKNRFHNFEQRSDKYSSEELETIAKRKREAYSKKLKGETHNE